MRQVAFTIITSAILFLSAAAYAADAKVASTGWQMRCDELKGKDGSTRQHCEMFQKLGLVETKQRLAEIALFKEGDGSVGGVVILPLGLLVAKPVIMQVDDNDKMAFSFHTCTPSGCLGKIKVNDALLKQMRKGNNVVFATLSQVGKPFSIKVSLKGFSKAYKELMAK